MIDTVAATGAICFGFGALLGLVLGIWIADHS